MGNLIQMSTQTQLTSSTNNTFNLVPFKYISERYEDDYIYQEKKDGWDHFFSIRLVCNCGFIDPTVIQQEIDNFYDQFNSIIESKSQTSILNTCIGLIKEEYIYKGVVGKIILPMDIVILKKDHNSIPIYPSIEKITVNEHSDLKLKSYIIDINFSSFVETLKLI